MTARPAPQSSAFLSTGRMSGYAVSQGGAPRRGGDDDTQILCRERIDCFVEPVPVEFAGSRLDQPPGKIAHPDIGEAERTHLTRIGAQLLLAIAPDKSRRRGGILMVRPLAFATFARFTPSNPWQRVAKAQKFAIAVCGLAESPCAEPGSVWYVLPLSSKCPEGN